MCISMNINVNNGDRIEEEFKMFIFYSTTNMYYLNNKNNFKKFLCHQQQNNSL